MNATSPAQSNTLDAIDTPKFLRPLERFLHIEAASGLVLLGAVAIALLWANVFGSESYEHFWHSPLGIQFGELTFSQPLHFYINDMLMTIFFLVVGLEIRREIHEGALANLRLAALPMAAALGGVTLPALIYFATNINAASQQGWAIPTATDIAFAIGFLTLLGNRVPPQLRILLLSIAIIDDVAAILVIAFFYSSGIKLLGLAVAALGMLLVRWFHTLGVRTALPYVIPGAVVWFGVLHAGVHPTIAGVILGLLTPVNTPVDRKTLLDSASRLLGKLRERFTNPEKDPHQMMGSLQQLKTMQREMVPPVVRVQVALHSWVAFIVMPVFALANAGVIFDQAALTALTTSTVGIGIIAGLVIGKPVGIVLASLLATRFGFAALPVGITFRGLVVIGCFGGIGLTMSLFLTQLSFADANTLSTAKASVLVASAIAAISGLILGRTVLKSSAEQSDRAKAQSH